MDKRYLDPRRPLGTPTKEDQAEMLVPYDVELPWRRSSLPRTSSKWPTSEVHFSPIFSPQHPDQLLSDREEGTCDSEARDFGLAGGLDVGSVCWTLHALRACRPTQRAPAVLPHMAWTCA